MEDQYDWLANHALQLAQAQGPGSRCGAEKASGWGTGAGVRRGGLGSQEELKLLCVRWRMSMQAWCCQPEFFLRRYYHFPACSPSWLGIKAILQSTSIYLPPQHPSTSSLLSCTATPQAACGHRGRPRQRQVDDGQGGVPPHQRSCRGGAGGGGAHGEHPAATHSPAAAYSSSVPTWLA